MANAKPALGEHEVTREELAKICHYADVKGAVCLNLPPYHPAAVSDTVSGVSYLFVNHSQKRHKERAYYASEANLGTLTHERESAYHLPED